MKNSLFLTQKNYQSTCYQTSEYLYWHEVFKKEFTKFLKSIGCTVISINKPNHFDMSGFFISKVGQCYFFRIEDLRWSKDKMLIRTAKNFKDYCGGNNQYVKLDNEDNFVNEFNKIVK